MSSRIGTETGHRALPHTADLIVEAWAPSRSGCLEELVRGVVETFADTTTATDATREVPLEIGAARDEDLVVVLLDVATLIGLTEETYGRLDVAFNNAGVEGIMVPTPDVTVAWLSSDAASFVTGHAMPFDGAFVAQ